MRYTLFIMQLLVCSCVLNQERVSLVSEQNWLYSVPTQFDDYPIIVLNDSTLIRRSKNNELMLHETVQYIVQKSFPQLLSRFIVPYSNISKESITIECAVQYKDGKSWELSSYDPPEHDDKEGDKSTIPDQCRTAYSFSLPKYEKSMKITVKTERRYKDTLFTPTLFFRGDFPTISKVITIDSNAIHHKLENTEDLTINKSVKESHFTYKASNLKPKRQTGYAKHDEEWYAGVHLSPYTMGKNAIQGWQLIGDNYLQRISHSLHIDSSVMTFAHKKKGITLEESCHNYFQEICQTITYQLYLNSSAAITPQYADSVLALGYGDCKGVSNLFFACMKTTYPEVPCGLALVATEGLELHRNAPSLSRFNHMIFWMVHKGDTLYIDPTNGDADWQTSYWPLLHRKVLLLDSGKSRVATITKSRHFENIIKTKNYIKPQYTEAPLTLSGIITLQGFISTALFTHLNSMHTEDHEFAIKQFLKKRFNIRANTCSMQKLSYAQSIINYETDITMDFIDTGKGGLRITTPSTFGGNTHYTTTENEGFYSMKLLNQQDMWFLPKEFQKLESSTFDTPLSKGKFALQSNKLTRNYQVKDNLKITKEQLRAFYKDKRSINNTTIWR